jgi:hypothetical protein
MEKLVKIDRTEAEGIGVKNKSRTKSSKNPRWRKHNHSQNGEMSQAAQTMGSLNGKTGYPFPEMKMTIYARTRKDANEMYNRLQLKNNKQ